MAASASRTTVRLTSDIWWTSSTSGGTKNTLQLLPSAAFRILDHQLHASGILPNNLSRPSNNSNNALLYNHAWYCASQSVTCVPLPATLHTQQCLLSNQRLVKAHIWITKIGTSSLQLANVLTVDDNDDNDANHYQTVLATAQRVFVRSAPFSEPEKQDIWQRGGALSSSSWDIGSKTSKNNNEASQLMDFYYGKGSETSSDTSISSRGSPTPLPSLERFHRTFPSTLSSSLFPILTVHIGPHHVNLGNHVDNTALLETAVHALWLHGNQTADTTRMIINNPATPALVSSVAINYFKEAKLGQVLECWVHDAHTYITTRPSSSSSSPTNNNGDVEESSSSVEPQLVAIAKAS
jgi:hypothetical protein